MTDWSCRPVEDTQLDPTKAAVPQQRKGTGQVLEVLALHGQDSALVRSQDGIAFYLPLSELEGVPQPGTAQAPESPGLLELARPENPKRFDRWFDGSGQEWIFDQPRNPDGSYASNDESTEVVESRMDWYLCKGTPVKAKHRPVLAEPVDPAEPGA